MSGTTYQVILSTDGKHTVIVATDDKQATEEALVWAKNAYDRVVKRYGLKNQQHHENGAASGAGGDADLRRSPGPDGQTEGQIRILLELP